MKEQLIIDANYCLLCKRPSCVEGCPARVNIPGMMKHVQMGDFEAAYEENRKSNVLPYLCGMLCPHEKQCEGHCIRLKKGKSVNIGFVEHGVAALFNNRIKFVNNQLNHLKIAIVGGGITGISAALELASFGANVTIYEKNDKIGGAVAEYLPSFRFDDGILTNLYQNLQELNVEVKFRQTLGIDFQFDDLSYYDYQIIALGSQSVIDGNLPLNQIGVYQGLDLLGHAKATNGFLFEKQNVLVIGAGNVAMDVARLIQLYNNQVTIVYRRTLSEAPASKKEIDETLAEGVLFKELLSPVDIDKQIDHLILKCQKMKLVQDNTSNGRKEVVPIEDSYEEITTDRIVLAIGSRSNHDWINNNPTPLILLNDKRQIKDDYQTTYKKLYLGGDYVTGPQTIVKAMVAGRDIARDIKKLESEESS